MHNSNSTLLVLLRWLPHSLLMKQPAIRLDYLTTIAKSLVIAVLKILKKLLAIPLARQKTPGKWLVMSSSFVRCRLVSPSNWNVNGRSNSKQRGLTLVELLVAISVLAFVAVLGWRGLDSIVRARIALTSDLAQTRGMQLTFAQLQNDCAHLASPSALPDRIPLAIDQGQLTLVRTVYADNQPSRLQVISYRVYDGLLTRRESPPTRDYRELDTFWQNAVNGTFTSQPVVLQSDVADMTMRLWINGGWRTKTDAVITVGDPVATQSVPTGLEVSLQLRGRDGSLLKIFLLGAV